MEFKDYFYGLETTNEKWSISQEKHFKLFNSKHYALREIEFVFDSDIEKELFKFCERMNIPVFEVMNSDGIASFGSGDDSIIVGIGHDSIHSERSTQLEIVFAHEIGHVIDCIVNFKNRSKAMIDNGVIEMEFTAWEYTLEILFELGFTEWDVFFVFANKCLDSYLEYYPEFIGVKNNFLLELKGKVDEVTVDAAINSITNKGETL